MLSIDFSLSLYIRSTCFTDIKCVFKQQAMVQLFAIALAPSVPVLSLVKPRVVGEVAQG